MVETVLGEINENEEKSLIQRLIDDLVNNMKFYYNLYYKEPLNPNFSYEVSLLKKIFLSKNEYVKNLIENNNNLEVFYKVIGEEVNNIFEQKLLLSDVKHQLDGHEEKEEKKPTVSFGLKTFMDLLREDIKIYKIYLENGDYHKALEEKKIEFRCGFGR